MDEHYLGEHYQDGGEVEPPQKTVKAYKLFRTSPKSPGQLFPLFVDANTPVPIGKWVAAKAGDPGKDPKKVKSKLGDLAYRPGWHAGDLPVATHIGGKSSPDLKAPDYRPNNHVWAEVEMPDDVDWQSVANSRMEYTKAGVPKPVTAHITDQVPFGGHYRYKTNPNMTGNWMIGGSMKVNRVLGDDEVKAINDANGAADLPRLARADGGQVDDGITAYHGSPHEFEQFDTSKIGTGEGAQSYGHGLYFAQAEPTAKQYRDQLSSPDSFKILKASENAHIPHAGLIQEIGHEVGEGVGQSQDEFKKAILNGLSARAKDADQYYKEDLEIVANSIKRGDWDIIPKNYGHMYEVHINAHPHHMLDWNKPLSEQSEHVQGALKNWELNYVPSHLTGGRLVEEMQKGFGEKGASEALAKAGIKGIKYLDAGSRNNKAEPTHNYVVFDHNDVQIKRKYEQGGRVGFDNGGSVHDQFLPHNHPQRQQNLGEFLKESAVKHPDGRPKVVYHNTSRSFNEFRTAKSEMGAHFGTPAQANDILEVIHDQPDHQGYPVYLNIKNPLRLRDTGTFDTYRVHRQLKEMGLAEGLPKNPYQLQMQEHLQSLGYDGVVYLNRREGISRAKGKDPERYNDYRCRGFLYRL
jgi:ADP-Ribosyltransferase in polyvalent proteins